MSGSDSRPGVRTLRCATCASIIAKQLPDAVFEIVRRRVVIALVRCGEVGCPTCGKRIKVGPCTATTSK